jgi:CrcB protein
MYKAGSRREESGTPATPEVFGDSAARPGSWLAALRGLPWLTLGVIAVGGALGALARQGLWTLFPHRAGVFDWATFGINVSGCFLIGALMTAVAEIRHAPRLTAPFLGVGVLGGFTTFSTYIVEIQQAIKAGAPQTGLAYLAATVAAAMLAVYAGVTVTRLLSRLHHRERS